MQFNHIEGLLVLMARHEAFCNCLCLGGPESVKFAPRPSLDPSETNQICFCRGSSLTLSADSQYNGWSSCLGQTHVFFIVNYIHHPGLENIYVLCSIVLEGHEAIVHGTETSADALKLHLK